MKTYASRLEHERRDPALAGSMSAFLPGAGQIYDGEPRRGLFFLAAGLINYSVLLLLLFARPILRVLKEFGHANNVVLNPELAKVIYHLQFGSAASIVLLVLFVGFAAYAARDAYDKAVLLQRQPIYSDHAIGMPEASSGSYLFHISFLLSCFVLAFFFLIPPPPTEQLTVIEFKNTEESTKEHQKTKVLSEHDSKAGGKHNPKLASSEPQAAAGARSKPVRTQSRQSQQSASAQPVANRQPDSQPDRPSSPQSKPQPNPQPNPQPKPTLVAANLRAVLPPQPVPLKATSAPAVRPILAPTASHLSNLQPTPSTPAPMSQTAPKTNVPLAMPGLPNVMATPVQLPKIAANSSLVPSSGAPAPVMVRTDVGSTAGAPVPQVIGARTGSSGSKSGGDMPTPTKGRGSSGSIANGGTSGPTGLAAAPAVGRGSDQGGSQGSGGTPNSAGATPGNSGKGQREQGNPDEGGARPGISTTPQLDWGAFMADLQRRIKRQWFPPKVPESKKVKAIFTVHRDGRMTNLRLLQSSGLTVSDQAALKAIEDAVPFRNLPEGAPESVDIEFTFDYNVFNGTGTARFKAY